MERNRSTEKSGSLRKPSGAAVMQLHVTDALSRAFFEEWARAGYAKLSLERVAKAAGVGKAALYRRWPSKAAMASDLVSRVGLTLSDIGDQGSLEADVRAQLLAFRRILRHRAIRRILVDLSAEIGREPALEKAIRPFQQVRRNRMQNLIDRAVARGELGPAVDRETLLDLLVAPLYWRLAVSEGRSDMVHIERLARMIAAAASVR